MSGSVITFYSYKGGVGRSMALANIAVLLARRGHRVLAVDWDLEAPGLERYFSYFSLENEAAGLLRMFTDASGRRKPKYQNYVSRVVGTDLSPFTFLPSGRDQNADYATMLETFDWAKFFAKQNGGEFVEDLRRQWREDFDFVLIDSRTGLSDTGGICTIQLPDIVVAMFTANNQSLYGTRDVMRLIQHARQKLAYDRMPLTILPLPARFGTRAEFQEGQSWLERFQETLHEFFDDWLPSTLASKDVLERIKVPQVDYFAFGEKLAVVEQGTNDPEGMGFVYDKVATLLASNFEDLKAVVGEEVIRKHEAKKQTKKPRSAARLTEKNYQYDLFVSYGHDSVLAEWLQNFLKSLGNELALYQPDVKIFFDVTELAPDMVLETAKREALARSKLLLAFFTPTYFMRAFTLAEFLTFQKREDITGSQLIVPIVLRAGELLPREVREKYQFFDLSETILSSESKPSRHVALATRHIAQRILDLLVKVPTFNRDWPVTTLKEAETRVVASPKLPRLKLIN